MSELEGILAEHSALASAGAGQFTVDPRRQRELLARLGLQSTSQGFLKLCQGIQRLRPARVVFRSGKNSLSVSFAHQLPLPEPVWEPSEPFGLALLNLSREYHLRWEFHRAGTMRSGHVAPESFRAEAPASSPHQECWTDLQITRPDSRWWHRDWTTGVRRLLGPRLQWSRIEWAWNGVNLFQNEALSRIATAVVLSTPDAPGELGGFSGWTGQLRVRLADRVIEPHDLLNRPGHAALGATRNSWSETFFVLDGVLLEGERNLLDRPGVVAVVSADGLTPALSGLELVHDAAFRQRLQGLRPEVSWLDSINQRG
ncbi:MAG: hypothetical protein KF760_32840 [Candidatus Eremiobacteraeota bacterium]|nr:hypothetical protein [Candidatus Eremiobacteraeota bacterium]MCW5868538.1 hypothetical protein [Candidatus Eremiobacteraeota bacterium]